MNKNSLQVSSLEDFEQDYSKWMEQFQNGCADPTWPDGTNLNLLRSHIASSRRRVVNDMENGIIPKQDLPDVPPEVPDDFLAQKEEKMKYIKTFKAGFVHSKQYQDYVSFRDDYDKYHQDGEHFPYAYYDMRRLLSASLDEKIPIIVFRQFGRKDVKEWWQFQLDACKDAINTLKEQFRIRKQAEKKPTLIQTTTGETCKLDETPWGEQVLLF